MHDIDVQAGSYVAVTLISEVRKANSVYYAQVNTDNYAGTCKCILALLIYFRVISELVFRDSVCAKK